MKRKYELSRGWRNNNPLNIRLGEPWQGMVEKRNQTDREFCQFLNMTWGYRAAAKCLLSYYRIFRQRDFPFDVINVICRWAPKSENDTEAYVRRVLELMGRDLANFGLASPYTKPGAMQLGLMVAAMTCVETGCPPSAVPTDQINAGFRLVGLASPELTPQWHKE